MPVKPSNIDAAGCGNSTDDDVSVSDLRSRINATSGKITHESRPAETNAVPVTGLIAPKTDANRAGNDEEGKRGGLQ